MRVRFEHVTKRFGAHAALQDVTLDVESGECLVLLGPSGCGKTTLLRLVAGLETADSGRIVLGDRDVDNLAPADRNVAMVFQNYALYPHLTVFQNIAFPLTARGVGVAEIRRRVAEAAERLDLAPCLERRPAQLSGGQQQRVALARALVRNPDVYLMDEPLSNLDAQLRVQTRSEVKRLQHELGTTTIYVTHDQEEAMTLGHRVAILRSGQIEQLGAPLDLYRAPATRFVAEFIGSPRINTWTAAVRAGDEVAALGLVWRISPALRAQLARAPRVVAGVRPEHVRVATAEAADSVQARVVVVEPVGNDTIVTLACENERVVSRQHDGCALTPGQPVWVSVERERALFFNADTDGRIF